MKNSYFLITLVVVSLALFVFVSPQSINSICRNLEISKCQIPDKPFRLGLDLLGGTHLVYEADRPAAEVDGALSGADWADAMQGVRDVVERRVNFFGVSEPLVQVSGNNRLIVELAGISDVNQAIQLIGETPFLEFREETDQTREMLDAQSRGERLNEEPFAATGLNGRHLQRAQIVFDPQTGVPQVSLQLTDEGAKLFSEITKRNIGKFVAIYLDGAPVSIPVVQNEIPDGQAVISGKFTPQEAKLLATRLNSGALPVPIKLISQQTVGSSLGKESLEKSLTAGLYGLLAVALFMIFFYRLPGVVSVFALGVYVLLVLATYKIIPVTLTLAGIAGFILSLGMAVDANVLIFARMREELKAGKTLTQSMEEGFRRAWLSVRDSHATTLIGALVLYVFTTSIVKGFALTLGIGVLMSLFTATMVTRKILLLFTKQWFEKKKWMF
ncbi:MAG: protein-export membrane protein SecD [Candidatus Yanofskybacteria bacterium RIFCSPHIGHO2_01_FULL_45_42]|uniref:Protein translocase subunit SecD n=2 Tax=Candidatus Yanofskyibacteriota TaxID=1752733 RepID=A0A1F8FSB0_9BACT|nr:MAG: protein-export membrane protein SecD [Candidatus Yanofskybacteria bacterium RIFCSPHIGHO2_01_FULL_45_42]OGN15229.1 MAG: protein-export membrane protein SecD [Candidatus Yanofskybacteria bacterium RIFCSPHIGHO2_02_FULL_43_22]